MSEYNRHVDATSEARFEDSRKDRLMGFVCDSCKYNDGYICPVSYDTSGQKRSERSVWVKCAAGKRTITRKPPTVDCFDYWKKGLFGR